MNTNRMISAGRRTGGFTLIEVLFAVAILAVGLLAVAALLPIAALQQKRALDQTLGANFGNGYLATIKAGGRDSFTVTPTPTPTYTSATLKKGFQISDPTGIYEAVVSYKMPNAGDPIDITVAVYRKMPTPDLVPGGYTYTPQLRANTGALIVDEPANNRTKIFGTAGGPASNPSTFADVFRREQWIIIHDAGGSGKYYLSKVTSGAASTGGAAYITPMLGDFSSNTTVTIYCLTDYGITQPPAAGFGGGTPTSIRAVSMVQGVIQ